jgi:phosphoheptose isomerase
MISEHASPLATLGGVDAGGQNVYVAETARQLAAVGHEVDVYTRRDNPDLDDTVAFAPGVRIVHIDAGPAEPVRKEDLFGLMEEFGERTVARCALRSYDIVHANFFMSGMVAMRLKRELDLPFVITFHALGKVRRMHQGPEDCFPDQRFAIEEEIVREADRIIAECPQDEEDLVRLYHAHPDRIVIVPCGFSAREFFPIDRTLARRRVGLPEDVPIILQLGRMVPRKGVATVVRAHARLLREHGIEARLVIVGGTEDYFDPRATPEHGRLASIVEEEGTGEYVTFTGRRDRGALKYYYSAADVFVTSPWYEPFGITPLESMACGTPVIGTNVGGIKFSVRDGETGYLVPPRDPDALAERMAHYFSSPALQKVLARQSLERVRSLFTWDSVANRIDTVYKDVVAGRLPHVTEETRSVIDHAFDALAEALTDARRHLTDSLQEVSSLIADRLSKGSKVLVAGNGGSAAEAQHFAAELVGRFLIPERRALPAMALCADGAVITAWANDMGYERAFARQVEAFGEPGDILIGLTTSGNSQNLIHAFETARDKGVTTVAIAGCGGGRLRALADRSLIVLSADVQRIQELQLAIIHMLCELIEVQVVAAEGNELSVVAATAEPPLALLPRLDGHSARAAMR